MLRLLPLIAIILVLLITKSQSTPLDDIVNQPDSNFKWEVISNQTIAGVRAIVLNMTSVQYLTTEYVNRVVWNHQVYIYAGVPNTASHALLFIDGGNNGDSITLSTDFGFVAQAIQTTIVVVKQIPNQPLVFNNDTKVSRTEDEIIAWGWKKFFESSPKDPRFLTHIYMTKASAYAMTAAEQVLVQSGLRTSLNKWVVAGGSKRGWATWLLAAVDARVTHFIPIVIDILNMRKTLGNSLASDCSLPEAMRPYLDEGFESYFNTTTFDALPPIIDPISYNSRFVNKPKLIVSASRDEFFGVNNAQQYYPEVLGEKSIRFVPNVGHSLGGSDVYDTLFSYYYFVLFNISPPTMNWTATTENNSTTLTGFFSPSIFTLTSLLKYESYNSVGRDFRSNTVATAYQSSAVTYDSTTRAWSVTVAHPTSGYKAFFVEAAFSIPQIGRNYKVTTLIYVVPDTYPCLDKVPIVTPPTSSSGTPRSTSTSKPPVSSSVLLQVNVVLLCILSALLF